MILILLLIKSIICLTVDIIAASKHENVQWLHDMMKILPNEYNLKIYRPNEIGYQYTTNYEKGFEACMYLRYIIDNYNELPDYIIFIHAHKSSWHIKDMSKIIPRINYNNLTYKNLNYDNFEKVYLQKNYIDNIYLQLLKKKFEYIDTYCCGQFIVNRDIVLRNDINTYKYFNTWLENTNYENFYTGRAFEYIWFYIFHGYENDTPYSHGLCSIINCTDSELNDKNFNFNLKYEPNKLYYTKY